MRMGINLLAGETLELVNINTRLDECKFIDLLFKVIKIEWL